MAFFEYLVGTQAFPEFDSFHAHCAMRVTMPTASCQQAFNSMKDAVQDWKPEPKAGGTYKMWDAIELEYFWATRTTASGKYVDDIEFEFFGNPANFREQGCTVSAKSRSQSLSFYDYNTNYCNMWNVFKVVRDSGMSFESSECKWAPKDPQTACSLN